MARSARAVNVEEADRVREALLSEFAMVRLCVFGTGLETNSLLCGGGQVMVGGFITSTEQTTAREATIRLRMTMKERE